MWGTSEGRAAEVMTVCGDAAEDAVDAESGLAGDFEKDEASGWGGLEDAGDHLAREADVLKDVAVEDEVGLAGGGVGDGSDAGSGVGAGDVVKQELGVAEEAEHEVAVVAAVVEDAVDFSPVEMAAEDGRELGAAGLVVGRRGQVGVEFFGIPGLEGSAHLEVLGGAVAAVVLREVGVVEAGVVEDESAGLALDEVDGEGVAVPDAPGEEWSHESPLEVADGSVANDAG